MPRTLKTAASLLLVLCLPLYSIPAWALKDQQAKESLKLIGLEEALQAPGQPTAGLEENVENLAERYMRAVSQYEDALMILDRENKAQQAVHEAAIKLVRGVRKRGITDPNEADAEFRRLLSDRWAASSILLIEMDTQIELLKHEMALEGLAAEIAGKVSGSSVVILGPTVLEIGNLWDGRDTQKLQGAIDVLQRADGLNGQFVLLSAESDKEARQQQEQILSFIRNNNATPFLYADTWDKEAPALQRFLKNHGIDLPIETNFPKKADEFLRLILKALGLSDPHREDFTRRLLQAAGLEEKGKGEGQIPQEAKGRLRDLLSGRDESKPLTVALQGFLPAGTSVTIGPITPEGVPQAIDPVLDSLPKGARVRWEVAPTDSSQLTLHLIFVPIVRTYPGNRTPWGLKAQFHNAWNWVDDGASLEKALTYWFGPRLGRSGLWYDNVEHPLIGLAPEQAKEILGSADDQLSMELLNISYWVFVAVINKVYHEKDIGKDARYHSLEPVTADEIVGMLIHRKVGGDRDIERFFRVGTEPVLRAFVEELLTFMGLDRPAYVDPWGPLVLGKASDALRDGARARIQEALSESNVVQVLAPSVMGSRSADEQEMLAQVVALSQGRVVLQGEDVDVAAAAVAQRDRFVLYRGTQDEFGAFRGSFLRHGAKEDRLVYFGRGRFAFEELLEVLTDFDGRDPLGKQWFAALLNDLRLLTEA